MTNPDDGSAPWVALEAIVATTHRVEKYGGIRIAENALQQIVDALNAGTLPMIGHHDWTKPIRTGDLEASIVELVDGVNRPGKSGDSIRWEGWSHVREYAEEVPGRAA